MAVSGALAAIKITAGLMGHSTAVVADGLESAGDVFASGIVLLGLALAARPADWNHPYGHGRIETVTGLFVGFMLAMAGLAISANALRTIGAASFSHSQINVNGNASASGENLAVPTPALGPSFGVAPSGT